MDAEEFSAEWERAALSWGKDPDSKIMGKLRVRWASGFKRENPRTFRQAIDRLVSQQPEKFPTFGRVKAELRSIEQSFRSVIRQRVESEEECTAAELYELADDLERAMETQRCSDQAVLRWQGMVLEYLREKAEARRDGVPPPRPPRVAQLLGAMGIERIEAYREAREPGMEG
jgi:hypothetical protein